MKADLKSLFLSLVLGSLLTVMIQPAHCQYFGDDSSGSKGSVTSNTSLNGGTSSAPLLAGVNCGVNRDISSPVVIAGVNTTGTVRINMLSNLESLVNIGANSAQIIGIIWGSVLLFACLKKVSRTKNLGRSLAFAILPVIGGLSAPGAINWVIQVARDANLFS